MIPHIDGKVNRRSDKNRPFGDLPDFAKTVAHIPRGATIKAILVIVGGWSVMQLLEQRILAEGEVKSSEILKSTGFEPSDGPKAVSGDGGGVEAAV